MGHKSRKARPGAIPKQELTDELPNTTTISDVVNENFDLSVIHSRRNTRLARRQRSPTPSPSPTLSRLALDELDPPDPSSMPPSVAAATNAAVRRPLLIISIGNPGKEFSATYHNAGHILARALLVRQQSSPTWTIHQSKAYMNLSGPEVQKHLRRAPASTRLVILHDDLEREIGSVRVRAGSASAQGHNGIRSIQQALGQGTGKDWWRVAVGVGRPKSRNSGTVADYVLSKMSREEMMKLEGSVERVVDELEKLAGG